VNVLHITDSHIHRDPDTIYKGLDPRVSFETVIKVAREQDWRADLVVLTGDMSHDGSPESYEFLRDAMLTFAPIPVYHLPGNHDQVDVMQAVMRGGNLSTNRHVVVDGWQIILLDSCLPEDEVAGELSRQELEFMCNCLEKHPYQPALVCLHHQPVDVGSAWIDTIGLSNKKDFNGMLRRYPQVKAVLWGHVHQEFSVVLDDILYMTTPSTCVQFMPGAAACLYDERQPGFRKIELHENGSISTSVNRL